MSPVGAEQWCYTCNIVHTCVHTMINTCALEDELRCYSICSVLIYSGQDIALLALLLVAVSFRRPCLVVCAMVACLPLQFDGETYTTLQCFGVYFLWCTDADQLQVSVLYFFLFSFLTSQLHAYKFSYISCWNYRLAYVMHHYQCFITLCFITLCVSH